MMLSRLPRSCWHTFLRCALAVMSLALVPLAPLAAQEANTEVIFHGYGGWAYGRTDGNTFDVGDHDGDYTTFNFAIAMATSPADRVKIATQVAVNHENERDIFSVNYAQVEWDWRDALKFRLGRVRQPFGLYTEVFQVGTIRPFFSLPQSIYSGAGMIAQSFTGISATGGRPLTDRWRIEYDAYGGHIALPNVDPLQTPSDTLLEHITGVIGGRLNFREVSGWLVGVSGYTGHIETNPSEHHPVLGAHLEYQGPALTLRAEGAAHHSSDDRMKVAYAEVGYRVTEHWQAAARVDRLHATFNEPALAQIPDGGKYQEQALGVNYWVVPEFVIKTSIHFTTGRRFALPQADANGNIPAGVLPKGHTTLGVFGAQVSF